MRYMLLIYRNEKLGPPSPDQAQRMREKSIIMHPLPRNDELSTDVDRLPQAIYLSEQVANGLYIRMAILKMLLAS